MKTKNDDRYDHLMKTTVIASYQIPHTFSVEIFYGIATFKHEDDGLSI